jgi:hypothetical protein
MATQRALILRLFRVPQVTATGPIGENLAYFDRSRPFGAL